MGALSKLPNVGKVIEEQLIEVGVTSPEKLAALGSQKAWLEIRKIDESACLNRLYALEGAIQGIRWHQLSQTDKDRLKAFYQEVK